METFGIAGGGEDMLLNDLTKLRLGLLGLLKRLSDELPCSKQKVVFLINNYDQVLSVFRERNIIGDDCARFEELLTQHRGLSFVSSYFKIFDIIFNITPFLFFCSPPCMLTTGLFVEEELLEGFSQFIAFVQHNEGAESVDAEAVEGLVRDFAATWKSAIEAIYHDMLDYFSDLRNGMEILKQVLTQLLLYYTRFQDIIKKAWARRQPPFAKEIVSTATILVEIKKNSKKF